MRRKTLIALPKGRLYEQCLDLLARAEVRLSASARTSRLLVLPDEGGTFNFVPLKPADIPVYVESGAIDAGIVGSDVLRELESDVFEPLDLRIGKCHIALAAPEGKTLSYHQNLRVATKYPRTADRFFKSRQAHVHIVKLDGSVEIAPLLGLADAIVDLVETGRTLKENGMRIVEEIAPVSARFIVNRTAMKMKAKSLNTLIAQLDRTVYANVETAP